MAKKAKSSPGIDGILLIDKPSGWTSHDVVARSRRLTGQRRIGHTGTLDPMATGLLVLCLGRATRLVEYMTGHDKRYIGHIRLGEATDTDDADGRVIARSPVPPLTSVALEAIAREFTGPLLQRPPAYSAVKIEGQRAYAAARAGKDLDLPPRPVTVHRLLLEQLEPELLAITVECGAGTYVRSLARDIGDRLGCGAHLASLRRTHVGGFDVGVALTLDSLEQIAQAGRLDSVLRAADEGVVDFDAAIVRVERGALLRHGIVLDGVVPAARAAEFARIYDSLGDFLAIGSVGPSGDVRALKVLQT
ncbi:MAG TPA: tRNA pseudouridine(55) synthase TruB [Tepidiformaceae bacterium]